MVIWGWIKQISGLLSASFVYMYLYKYIYVLSSEDLRLGPSLHLSGAYRRMTILFPTSNSKLNPCIHVVTEVSILYKVGRGRDARYIFQRKCCFQSKRHPKITGLDLQHCPKNKLFDKQIQQFLSEERLRLNLWDCWS